VLQELAPSAFASVRDLFAPLRFRLDTVSVLDEGKRGRIWVDDPESPRAAFLVGTMACFVAGTPDARFCRDLNRLITESLYVEDPLGLGRKAVRIVAASSAWEDRMGEILEGRTPIPTRRRYSVFDLAVEPPDFPLPDGCETRAVDAAMMADPAIEVGRMVVRPMEWGYGSVEAYLEHCFACVAIRDGRTVAFSPVNNLSGTLCELGIATDPEHRRRGLGVATVAAALRMARERGMTRADWHCDPRNPGSVRVAEKVGFTLDREYLAWLAVGDERIHEEERAKWERGKPV